MIDQFIGDWSAELRLSLSSALLYRSVPKHFLAQGLCQEGEFGLTFPQLLVAVSGHPECCESFVLPKEDRRFPIVLTAMRVILYEPMNSRRKLVCSFHHKEQ